MVLSRADWGAEVPFEKYQPKGSHNQQGMKIPLTEAEILTRHLKIQDELLKKLWEKPPIKIECTHQCHCKATSSWDIFWGIISAASVITLTVMVLLP